MKRQVNDKTAKLARMEDKAKTFMRSCISKYIDTRGGVNTQRLAEATCDKLHDEYCSQYYCWANQIAVEYQKTLATSKVASIYDLDKTQATSRVASIYDLDIEYKTITMTYAPKLKQNFNKTNCYLTFSNKNQWLEVDVNDTPLVENESTKHHEHYVMVNVGDTIAVRVYEADNTAEPCGTLTGTVTATKLAYRASEGIRPTYSTKNSVVHEHKRPTWA
jgi:hypothetical protein